MKINRIGNIYNDPNGYNSQAGRVYSTDGISPCLKTPTGGGSIPLIPDGKGIRKLTPKETFRLQGWTDDYFAKAEFINSDTQLYKQAGNGVTVTVVKAIGERLAKEELDELAKHMNRPEREE